MEQLKKSIINNLYKSNFYEALTSITKLEGEIGEIEEVFFFYYFLYDLMEWLGNHKKDDRVKEIRAKKEIYFNKINQQNGLDKSSVYVKLYGFLRENFRTFERYTWFGKKEKSLNFLNLAQKENSNNLEVKFYILFCEGDIKGCFDFLTKNILDNKIVEQFLNEVWYKEEYLDESQQLRKVYAFEYNDFIYNSQKKTMSGYTNILMIMNKRKIKINICHLEKSVLS